jgi:hypothetical protein
MRKKIKGVSETHGEYFNALGLMSEYGVVIGIEEDLGDGLEENLNSMDLSYFRRTEREFLQKGGRRFVLREEKSSMSREGEQRKMNP